MERSVRRALSIAGCALVLGLAADLLLQAGPWGLNFALWCLALVGSSIVALRLGGHGEARATLLLLASAALTAALVAWRDAPPLMALNVLGTLLLLALAAGMPRTVRVWALSLWDTGIATVIGSARVLWQPILLVLEDLPLPSRRLMLVAGPGVAVVRGAVLTAPLLLLFFLLFVAADSAFASLTLRLFSLRIDTLVAHLATIAVFGWLSAGYMRDLSTRRIVAAGETGPASPRPALDVLTSLALLDLLFLAFVLVQLRYLFGAAPLSEAGSSLTHAEYARRGFFELVAVAALAFPTVLVTISLAGRAPGRQRQVALALAGLLILLVGVVIVSAAQRMRLYTDAFGLTEARLYASVFMLWLTLCFALLALAVLRGRVALSAVAVIVPALALLAALNVLSPDRLIARVNLDRAERGERFDAAYLTGLSADATPTLVAGLSRLNNADRCLLLRHLLAQRESLSRDDRRVWSIGRQQARDALVALPPAAGCED